MTEMRSFLSVSILTIILVGAAGANFILPQHMRPNLSHMKDYDFREVFESLQFLQTQHEERSENSAIPDLNELCGILLTFLHEASTMKNITKECRQNSKVTLRNIKLFQPWALKMCDATAKFPSGLLEGNTWWLGSFSECLAIRASPRNITSGSDLLGYDDFQGEYTTLLLFIYGAMFRIGMCVPSPCTNWDVFKVLVSTILPSNNTGIIPLLFTGVHKDEGTHFDGTAIGVICVFSLFGLIVLIGTVYDVYLVKFKKNAPFDLPWQQEIDVMYKSVLAFSLYTNTKKLVNTRRSPDSIDVIHGLRFFSLTWVLIGHSYEFAVTLISMKNSRMLEEAQTVPFMAIENATFSVDTFYFMSGFLVAYIMFKEMANEGSHFNIFMYYFHRYWRLTPVYAMVIAWAAGFWYIMGDGPLWSEMYMLQDDCRAYWWRHLLYIQNFFDDSNTCVAASWYLATDMQMYIVAPIILYCLCRYPKVGLGIWACCLAGTLLATGLILGINDYPGLITYFNYDSEKLAGMQLNVYQQFYCRMGPFLVGIMTAFIMHIKQDNLKVDKVYVISGWIFAAALGTMIIYGPYPYFTGDKVLGPCVNMLYGIFARTFWSVAVAWVTYACVAGHGGIINEFLSWKAFVPLSRLSYCVYLVHFYVFYTFYLTRENEFYFDHFFSVYVFLGSMVLSYGVAYVFSMMFEVPMIQLEKVFIPKKTFSTERDQVLTEQTDVDNIDVDNIDVDNIDVDNIDVDNIDVGTIDVDAIDAHILDAHNIDVHI